MHEPAVPFDSTPQRIVARVVPNDGYARANERYEIEMPVALQVLVPGRPNESVNIEGRTGDVSALGMGINVESLHVNTYRKLLTRQPVLRVTFADPADGRSIQLQGKIAWIDYRKSRASDTIAPCRVGVRFNDLSDSQIRPFREFIDRIEPV